MLANAHDVHRQRLGALEGLPPPPPPPQQPSPEGSSEVQMELSALWADLNRLQDHVVHIARQDDMRMDELEERLQRLSSRTRRLEDDQRERRPEEGRHPGRRDPPHKGDDKSRQKPGK